MPGWPGHVAGQHVDVRLTAEDGYQAQRSYSIASAPEDGELSLTIERIDDGEVSSNVDELYRWDQGLYANRAFLKQPTLQSPPDFDERHSEPEGDSNNRVSVSCFKSCMYDYTKFRIRRTTCRTS